MTSGLMPQLPRAAGSLLVNEIYRSLEGEGLDIGLPMTFVRLTGCPLRCVWCDQPEAFFEGSEMTLDEVLGRVAQLGVRRVCVTGGEPLAHRQCPALLERLLAEGYKVVLETSGAFPIAGLPDHADLCRSVDVKCPGSGMSDRNLWANLGLLGAKDQVKFVIVDRGDYEYAKEVLGRHAPRCPVVLQPEGGRELGTLAEWVLADCLDVRVLPQLHKVIWGEAKGR
jgi:7-carboxy-7-deazaguanine synthase